MEDWEQIENEKYSHLYKNGYPSGHPMIVISWAKENRDQKVLDVGCGLGTLSEYFSNYTGVDVSKYVISRNKKNNKGIYHNIGITEIASINDCYDILCCFDVLEHIPEEHIDKALKALSSVKAIKKILNISTRKSGILDKHGGNLHLTIWDKEKWMKKLSEYFDIRRHSSVNKNREFHVLMQNKIV